MSQPSDAFGQSHSGSNRPVSVVVMNDHPIIIEGIAAMLSKDPRLHVEEISHVLVPGTPVDVVLFDAYASPEPVCTLVERLVADSRFTHVVLYTWNVEAQQVDEALACGVSGYLSKVLGPADLADALVRIAAGERVVEPIPMPADDLSNEWPGREFGLSAREGEVVSLITQGLTNEQIAESCFLSINSVKSYIRSAYRKMGVERRSQAVLWGVEHGMAPKPQRHDV